MGHPHQECPAVQRPCRPSQPTGRRHCRRQSGRGRHRSRRVPSQGSGRRPRPLADAWPLGHSHAPRFGGRARSGFDRGRASRDDHRGRGELLDRGSVWAPERRWTRAGHLLLRARRKHPQERPSTRRRSDQLGQPQGLPRTLRADPARRQHRADDSALDAAHRSDGPRARHQRKAHRDGPRNHGGHPRAGDGRRLCGLLHRHAAVSLSLRRSPSRNSNPRQPRPLQRGQAPHQCRAPLRPCLAGDSGEGQAAQRLSLVHAEQRPLLRQTAQSHRGGRARRRDQPIAGAHGRRSHAHHQLGVRQWAVPLASLGSAVSRLRGWRDHAAL